MSEIIPIPLKEYYPCPIENELLDRINNLMKEYKELTNATKLGILEIYKMILLTGDEL